MVTKKHRVLIRHNAARPTIVLATSWADGRLLAGIHRYAKQANWHLLDLRHYDMRMPRAGAVDGALILLYDMHRSLLKRIRAMSIPIVQMAGYLPHDTVPGVVQNQSAVGHMGAEHFLERGFRTFASVETQWERQTQRAVAFREHVEAEGYACTRLVLPHAKETWQRFRAQRKALGTYLATADSPVALFPYHDRLAVRVIEMCHQLKYDVPEQVAVLGCDNDVMDCECAGVPLSSIEMNPGAMGYAAAELMDRLLRHERSPDLPVVVEPKHVVTRRSTDIQAISDLVVARALRCLWDRFRTPLSVDDVARDQGVSRRKLERHFRASLGRGVAEELNRKRLEHACALLRSSTDTIKDVAHASGFGSPEYFYAVFAKHIGDTPRQYRLKHARRHRG